MRFHFLSSYGGQNSLLMHVALFARGFIFAKLRCSRNKNSREIREISVAEEGGASVYWEVFAGVLFSRNFANAKFRENEILAKFIGEISVA